MKKKKWKIKRWKGKTNKNKQKTKQTNRTYLSRVCIQNELSKYGCIDMWQSNLCWAARHHSWHTTSWDATQFISFCCLKTFTSTSIANWTKRKTNHHRQTAKENGGEKKEKKFNHISCEFPYSNFEWKCKIKQNSNRRKWKQQTHNFQYETKGNSLRNFGILSLFFFASEIRETVFGLQNSFDWWWRWEKKKSVENVICITPTIWLNGLRLIRYASIV